MKILPLTDYTYDLPEEKIARFPLPVRDQSKLLVYAKGEISHKRFYDLPQLLPANSLLIFNDTKVIPARLNFTKDTGALIEIFLLSPHEPDSIPQAMQSTGCCLWKCAIGNLKRWKTGTILKKSMDKFALEATLVNGVEGIVKFEWANGLSFAQIIDLAGETPLPPYLHRKPETADRERYQTIYSHSEGAVAAPTAGLHFTPMIMEALMNKGIQTEFLTLHVSAGTFQPIKTEDASLHKMHREQIILNRSTIQKLLTPGKLFIPVGTTSMRTLESIYWWGVKLLQNKNVEFNVEQNDPYDLSDSVETEKSLRAVTQYMDENNLATVTGYSSIYIRPGYRFKLCNALITNFHQPASTLILLVAAFAGDDWRKIYQEAIEKDYRFLSYGDSSLLMPGGG